MGIRTVLDRCGKSRPTGIRSPDRPARSQSLYRLRYPAHQRHCYGGNKRRKMWLYYCKTHLLVPFVQALKTAIWILIEQDLFSLLTKFANRNMFKEKH